MKTKTVSIIIFAALVLAACAPAPKMEEKFVPAVTVADQEVVEGSVVVPEVTSDGQGWIVIHADADGAPGPVVGYSAVANGKNMDVKVMIDEEKATDKLFAMLHIDAGAAGTYEFPGADAPAKVGDAVVMMPFMLTAADGE